MITCPGCAADVDVEEEDLDEGDLFDCTECGVNLRVASLKPLELVALGDAEDADDEDDDFDDEDEEEEEEEEKEDDFEGELEEEEDEEDDWN